MHFMFDYFIDVYYCNLVSDSILKQEGGNENVNLSKKMVVLVCVS